MKLNLMEMNKQAIESTTGSKKMRLSDGAASMVFQLFTKNVYSNPIGTVVREIASNCFDSHIEANVDMPVLIKRSKDEQTGTEYISFIDFGVGVSPERMENIYSVYFESTKRVDNEQIGGFGIGAKTPLAYKRSNGSGEAEYDNSFNVITNFDGIKYYYLIFEGAESPEFTLLHSEPTDEPNGTEVRIPILLRDIQRFESEMIKQLYYFENIVFEGFDKTILNNEYKIIQGENFLYRGSDVYTSMHICLGRVTYPIDYNVLNLDSSDYNVPIALRLNVGDINVTVSRESLDYNEQTIKFLKKKLETCKKELIDMLVKQYDNITGLKEYFEYKNKFGYLNITKDISIPLSKMIKAKDVSLINFKFADLPVLDSNNLFTIFFEVKMFGQKEKKNKYSWRNNPNDNDSSYFNRNFDGLSKVKNLYFNDGSLEIKRLKQAWLKHNHSRYYIVLKKDFITDDLNKHSDDKYNPLINKMIDVNGVPTTTGELFLAAQEEYYQIVKDYAVDYKTVEIPEDFVANTKRDVLSTEILNTTIPIRFCKGGYNNYKDRVKLDDLFKYKSIIYYGTLEDQDLISNCVGHFNLFFDNNLHAQRNFNSPNNWGGLTGKKRANGNVTGVKSILFIQLAKNNLQYMKYCLNAHHISEYKNKMVHRKTDLVLKTFQTYKLINDFDNVHDLYKSKTFNIVSPEYGKKISIIDKYIKSLPSNKNGDNIKKNSQLINKFYDVTDIKMDKKQIEITKLINEIQSLEKKNEKILSYINIPYRIDRDGIDNEFVEILKLVMNLS